jgi:hypothetical protein
MYASGRGESASWSAFLQHFLLHMFVQKLSFYSFVNKSTHFVLHVRSEFYFANYRQDL